MTDRWLAPELLWIEGAFERLEAVRVDASGTIAEVGPAPPGAEREAMPGQPLAQRPGLRPADVGQRDVGPPGVPAEPGPLGLAMADQPDLALDLVAHSVVEGGTASSGVAAKKSRRRQPKSGARSIVGSVEIRVL